jgi:hypothetical protein
VWPNGIRKPGARPLVADAGVLHVERVAGEARLEVGGEAEVGCLVLDVVFQVLDRVFAHASILSGFVTNEHRG